jgi:hypothetical protein
MVSVGAAPALTVGATAASSGAAAAPVFLATSMRRPALAAVSSVAFYTISAAHALPAR